MNHRVFQVQSLYDDSKSLLNNGVVGGGESSADTILNNLYMGIENLKANWKGRDAGVQIQSVIKVYNAMVVVRNALAALASDSAKVASDYRQIQNANAAGLEELNVLAYELKTVLPDYTDVADTIDINPEANGGRTNIDNANNSMDAFVGYVKLMYGKLMDNWQEGPGRDAADQAYNEFVNHANEYKETLSDVSRNIATALSNYSL